MFSPDSTRVVYRADQDADEVFELFSVPIAGGTAVQLNGALVTSGDVQEGFEVAPDSGRVAYTADQDVNDAFELYSVPLAGGVAIKLNAPALPGEGVLSRIRIAPDSSRVVFLQTDLPVTELYSVPIAGGAVVKVNAPLQTNSVSVNFAISADSSTVVYSAFLPPAGGRELASAPITGGASTLLSGSLASGRNVEEFAITPDASRVLYRSDQNSNELFELFSVPLGGGSLTQLHPPQVFGGEVLPDFLVSADGTRVVYHAADLEHSIVEVFSTPIASASPVRLNPSLATSNVTAGDVGRSATSADGRWVVYMADQDTDDEFGLYSVRLPGRTPTRIDAVEDVRTFRIAPDASRVVYVGIDWLLRSVPVAGGASTVLADLASSNLDDAYRISADSSRVVYLADADDDGFAQLSSVPIAGGASTQLSGVSGGVGALGGEVGFRVSPDSTRVVYLANQDQLGVEELYSVPIGGGAVTKLNPTLSAPAGIRDSFQISADSSRVVYVADQDVTGTFEIYSVPLGGGTSIRLSGALVAGGEVNASLRVLISPDASRVVYVADQDTNNVFELFSVPLAGGASTKLSGSLVAGGDVATVPSPRDAVAISPDSTRVTYVADQDTDDVGELYSVPIDGSAASVKLNGPLVAGGDVGIYFLFQGDDFAPPRISADSNWVVYRANEDVLGVFELYAAPIGGGPSTKLNLPLAAGADVELDFAITDDSSRAVYRAQLDPTHGPQLYGVTLTGSFQTTQLNPTLIAGGGVHSFELSGGKVTYLADQDEVDAVELYLSYFVRTHHLPFPGPVGQQ